MNHILELSSLSKTFGSTKVVNSIDLSIPKNTIYGLLGPNGAGKTTIIRMITSIIKPDSGRILFNGEPLNRKHISDIGYMPEERGLYKKMKVKDQLIYLSRIRGFNKKEALNQIEYWSERLEIKDWWSKKIEELSKGMQQKIQFIATVLHDPTLIILDEPFSGLDPINTNLIKSEILQLHKQGASIIFSTHRMEQIEEICHDIALINQGDLILHGKLKEIKNSYKKNLFKVIYEGTELGPTLSEFDIQEMDKGSIVVYSDNDENRKDLLKTLGTYTGRITSFYEILPSLNEIFITTVNRLDHE